MISVVLSGIVPVKEEYCSNIICMPCIGYAEVINVLSQSESDSMSNFSKEFWPHSILYTPGTAMQSPFILISLNNVLKVTVQWRSLIIIPGVEAPGILCMSDFCE